jgi:CpeT protein
MSPFLFKGPDLKRVFSIIIGLIALTVFTIATGSALADQHNALASARMKTEQSQNVAQWLSGKFDSSQQAAQDASYFNISLISCPVSVATETGVVLDDANYLYIEQAIAGRENAPYRQRIYRVSQTADQDNVTVQSEILLLKEPAKFLDLCSKNEGERVVVRAEIEERGCSVFLQKTTDAAGEVRFEGRTPAGGCPSNHNGATTVESTVSLGEKSLIAWDIGRDAQGNQVWGPKEGPYIFLRR